MALVRYHPFREMEDIQRQLNRLFDDMVAPSHRPDSVGSAFMPAMEFNETKDTYHLKLEIPGMNSDDLNIEATAEAITIGGERRSEVSAQDEGMTRSEFRYGKFQRVIPLPGRIDNQGITADYKDGVLMLTLPKAEEERNKVVKVGIKQS